MNNLESTVISQYANAPTIGQIIADFNEWIDPTVNLQQFYSNIWNIYSAQGFGLDIWGDILGVTRFLQVDSTSQYLGFHGSGLESFNNGPFFTGGAVTQIYELSDAEYLPLLLTKALANISATTIPALNQMLQYLFADFGTAYVQDDGGMQMTFVFDFVLTPVQYAIVATSGVFPHPTGVLIDISTAGDDVLLTETSSDMLTEGGLDILLG